MCADKTRTTAIRKQSIFAFVEEEDKMPLSVFFAKDFIGYVNRQDAGKGETSESIYLLCKPAVFEALTTPTPNDGMATVKSWNREGNYYWNKYHTASISSRNRQLRQSQELLIKEIQDFYRAEGSCVAYVYGPRGCGKSTAVKYLARRLGGTACKTFNPSEPGDTFEKLLRYSSPSESCPLVIVFDECAGMIRRIRDEKIQRHKNIPIQIADVAGWNSFLDDFGEGSYCHCILVMICNESPRDLLKVTETKDQREDMFYPMLREGRVNLFFAFSANDVKVHTKFDDTSS